MFKDYRRREYAQKAYIGLIGLAVRAHGVRTFVISLSPKNKASMALAQRLGYVKVTEQMGPIDGFEEVYVLEGQALEIALNLLEFYLSDEAT